MEFQLTYDVRWVERSEVMDLECRLVPYTSDTCHRICIHRFNVITCMLGHTIMGPADIVSLQPQDTPAKKLNSERSTDLKPTSGCQYRLRIRYPVKLTGQAYKLTSQAGENT